MKGGYHNMIRGHARSLLNEVSYIRCVAMCYSYVIDRYKNKRIGTVSYSYRVKVEGIEYTVGDTAVKISGDIRSEWLRYVKS